MIKKVELLAPAGDMDSLVSAIKAGADAVYLGTDKFSARSKAYNFNREEVKKAVEYAHLRGVKIYVTLNILLLDEEIEEAFNLVEYLDSIGIDGIIVQDVGFSTVVANSKLSLEVHASTQMAINNLYGAKTVESFGFNRVVLARETSLEDMRLIDEETSLDIEGFIHGALCVSFSGECLMSSMIGGRSGNRGNCAQACRKSYRIIGLDNKEFENKYYLSPKDLNSLNTLDSLIDSGIYSLKIEGRMKSPEYVYQIVSSYKKAINDKLTKKDQDNVEQIFSRGFTKGISFGDFGNDFIAAEKPNNRGRLIGKVIGFNSGCIEVELFDEIQAGDGIEIFSRGKSIGFKADKLYKSGKNSILIKKDISLGAEIYKNFSQNLDKQIKEKLNEEVKYRDLSMFVELRIGENPKIILKTDEYEVEYSSNYIVEEAKTKGVSKDKIFQNLSKLGGSIYRLEGIDCHIEDNIFIPISEINLLRREAIEILDKKYLTANETKKINYKLFNVENNSKKNISVEINNLDDLRNIKVSDEVSVCFPIDKYTLEVEKFVKEKNLKLSGVFKKFQSTKELEKTLKILKSTDIFKEVYINNLSQISLLDGIEIDKVADIGLNVFNTLTVSKLLELGFVRVVLSPELNKDQIKEIAGKYHDYIEILSHGLIPVMTMIHCPMSVNLGCKFDADCESCKYSGGFFLEDFKNEKFLVERTGGISEIFNSHPIMLSDKIKTYMDYKISKFKLNVREDIFQTIDLYDKILNREEFDDSQIKNNLINKYGNITYGHYNRGVQNG